MHDLGMDLWRMAKELKNSEAGSVLTLAASLLIVAAASWNVARRTGRVVRAGWRWARGGGKANEQADNDIIEGA